MPAQFLRQGGEERRQPLDHRPGFLDQATRQRRHLEDQRARLGAEAFEAGHEPSHRPAMAASRKCGLGAFPRPSSPRITASQTKAGAFTTKLKWSGTCLRIALVLQRSVIGA